MNGILLNENLPASLKGVLQLQTGEVIHVKDRGLHGKSDLEVWSLALVEGLAVMTKDSDYVELLLSSSSGKVILVASGNTSLADLKQLVQSYRETIEEFLAGQERILILK